MAGNRPGKPLRGNGRHRLLKYIVITVDFICAHAQKKRKRTKEKFQHSGSIREETRAPQNLRTLSLK